MLSIRRGGGGSLYTFHHFYLLFEATVPPPLLNMNKLFNQATVKIRFATVFRSDWLITREGIQYHSKNVLKIIFGFIR